jgi:transcriptional activator of cad operon
VCLPAQDYRIDGWLVQPALNRLVKDMTAIRVRPQLIDVLTCLAQRPGTVVSKGQLLATVWNDRFVAESGVARCVAELRQVLADDARQPRIIETIPKRGYRLIAPVERVAQTPPALSRPAPAPPVAPTPAPVPSSSRFAGWWVAARAMATASLALSEVGRHLARRVLG